MHRKNDWNRTKFTEIVNISIDVHIKSKKSYSRCPGLAFVFVILESFPLRRP